MSFVHWEVYECMGLFSVHWNVCECTQLSVDCLDCFNCPEISICVLGYSGVPISIHLSLHNVDFAT